MTYKKHNKISLKNFLKIHLVFLSLGIFLVSCEEGTSRSFKDNPRRLPRNELVGVSPAFDPSILSDEEKELFGKLNPIAQKTYALLSEKQRKYFLGLLKIYPPNEAVWKAAENDVLQMPQKDQKLYFKLSDSRKLLFLALDDGPTLEAVRLSKSMSTNEAVDQATIKEIESYPENFQKFAKKLSSEEKALFFSLSYKTQQEVIKNTKTQSAQEALDLGKQTDIKRLPLDQQAFISLLDPLNQILFLILSPEKRGMCLFLTKKLDVNLAIEYAYFIEP